MAKLERLIERSSDYNSMLIHDMGCGASIEFRPESLFEYLWSLPEKTWWYETFELRTNFVGMKVVNPESYLDGDARISMSHVQHMASAATASSNGSGKLGNNVGQPAPHGPAFEAPAAAAAFSQM